MNVKRDILIRPPQPPWLEKHGNIPWICCCSCEEWFHVSMSLLQADQIKLHCPHCGGKYKLEEPKQLVEP